MVSVERSWLICGNHGLNILIFFYFVIKPRVNISHKQNCTNHCKACNAVVQSVFSELVSVLEGVTVSKVKCNIWLSSLTLLILLDPLK